MVEGIQKGAEKSRGQIKEWGIVAFL